MQIAHSSISYSPTRILRQYSSQLNLKLAKAYTDIVNSGILGSLSLVPTCRKNRGFSPSGVCECILNKLKYGTNI